MDEEKKIEMYKSRLVVANKANEYLEEYIEKLKKDKLQLIKHSNAANKRVKKWRNKYNILKQKNVLKSKKKVMT